MSDEPKMICGLCSCEYTGMGNNSVPLADEPTVNRCCDTCNAAYVIPARILNVTVGSNSAKFIRSIANYSNIGRLADFHLLREHARKLDPSI